MSPDQKSPTCSFLDRRSRGISERGACLVATGMLAVMSSVVGRADTLVYLIAGQSNADGRALSVELPSDQRNPQAEIPFYYRRYPEKEGVYTVLQPGSAGAPTPPGSAFGPEVSFGYTLAKWIAQKGGTDRIAIVKFARGGSSLAADWHGGGTATREGDALWYGVFQDTVSEGLAALRADSALKTGPLKVAGVIWVQGESDINEGPDRYAQNLETFIRDIRLTYGADLPFFYSKLSVNQTRYQRPEKPEIVQGFHSVRKAQEDIAAKVLGVHLISTDGPEFSVLKDKIHFDAPGQQALGAALAQAVIDTGVPAPSPSRPTSVENGRNNLDAP